MPNAVETLGTGETFTTNQSWEDALAGDHAHRGEDKAEVFGSVLFSGVVYATGDGPTLTSVDGAEHDGRAHEVSGVGNARMVNASGRAVYIDDDNVVVSWLEITAPGAGNTYATRVDEKGTIHHCVVHNNGAGGTLAAGFWGNDPSTVRAYRNIYYGYRARGFSAGGGGSLSVLLHNTVFECNQASNGSFGGIGTADTSYQIKANACFDNNIADIVGTAGTLSNNATSDATATEGTNNLINQVAADVFVNATTTYANTDLLLKSGSNLIDAGETTFSTATYPEIDESIDNRGVSITGTWDIGAHQFVGGVGPTIINMDILSGSLVGKSLVVTPGEVSTAMDLLTGSFSVESLVVTPGIVTMAMGTLGASLSTGALVVSPGEVSTAMDLLSTTITSPSLTITPGAVTITLDSLGLSGVAKDLVVTSGVVVEIIGTGETYTTIQAWEDDLNNLNPYRGECKAEAFSNVTFNGEDYTDLNFPTLTSVDGAEHDGRAHEVSGKGNARIEFTGAASPFDAGEAGPRLSWMEIKGPGDNGFPTVGFSNISGTAPSYVHHNIVHNNRATDGGSQDGIFFYRFSALAQVFIYRNIVYGAGRNGLYFDNGGAGSVLFLNTSYDSDDNGIRADENTIAIEANAVLSSDINDIANTNGALSNNATSDATATEGTNNLINQVATDTFVSATKTWVEMDLLLKAGSNLINAGETTYSTASYPEIDVSIDNRGVSITGTWDIGACHLVGPGAIIINLDILSGSFIAESLTISPGEVSQVMNLLGLTGVAKDLVVTPGAVTISMDSLILMAALPSLTVSNIVTIQMDTLGASLSAGALVVAPGEASISMSVLAAALAADSLVVTPGAVTISMDLLVLSTTLPSLTVFIGITIQMDTLGTSLSAGDLVVTPGEVSTAMDTTSLSGAALFLDVQPGEYIASMDTLAGTLVSKAIVIEPGEVSIDVDLLVGAVVAKALTVSPGAVSTALDLLTTNLTIESLIVVPGEATVSMNTIAGTLQADSVTIITFPEAISIILGLATITLVPLGLVLIPGEMTIAMETVTAVASALHIIGYNPFTGIDTTITSTTVIRTLISGTTLYTIIDTISYTIVDK